MRTERRQFKRFPVLRELAEPVDIHLSPSPLETKQPIPGIISDLSAGGVALITFVPISPGMTLSVILDIPGLEKSTVQGKVVRQEAKGGSYLHGIKFTEISEKLLHRLNHLGKEYEDCQIKLSLGVTDECSKKCSYWDLCSKPVKVK